MGMWFLIATGGIIAMLFVLVFTGAKRERVKAAELVGSLVRSAANADAGAIEFAALSGLPPPVVGYFKLALTEGQPLISTAIIKQSGVLRTRIENDRWAPFTARQTVVPPATGFVWNARVVMPMGTHVRVLDSYLLGQGAGRVSVLSALALASEAGSRELNSGALHRYLAEAVWYPTALLPQSGVAWSPIGDRSALATLSHGDASVSLEFRFDEAGYVAGIYSPGRFGRFNGHYKRAPWEGHFRDYREWCGVRVPSYGEVGWWVDGSLQLVWKGHISDVRYEPAR